MSVTKAPRLAAPAAAGVYGDDEPLERQIAAQAPAPVTNGGLALKTQFEFPALGRGTSWDKFAVLVHAKAPADVPRAPLDLVTVLDISGSMKGEKLALLKQAMCFVIDQLGPADRLSVVTFSDNAGRLTRLALMTDAGKAAAKLAVASLVVQQGTNIREGLRVGAQVLGDRRHKNVVASMILLSDGKDTYVAPTTRPDGTKNYTNLVPPSFAHAGSRPAPIHTFGFGVTHDAAAMHAVAEATAGTFSFVENQAAIQDSFARCIGGLLSVAVQGARIAVTCLHRGVRVQEVKSGCYGNHVAADGRAASIDVGELYDDEERRFLVLVYVPRARATEEVTRLLKASCTYKDAATGIAAARAAADGGEHAGAARILDSRLKAVERSAPGAAGDPTCEALKKELRDLSARVGDRQEYQQTGRACLLAGMSSHAQQRASGADMQSTSKPTAYLTPKMVEISRETRKRGNTQQQPDGGTRTLKQIKEDLTENF
ncbi:hypothetical protein BS78_06G109800 [Paspalum vaginatum]|nr:hypothetical protein BS78_06G109800 [Paspalum vaginatum]